jgi:hypothetical protein
MLGRREFLGLVGLASVQDVVSSDSWSISLDNDILNIIPDTTSKDHLYAITDQGLVEIEYTRFIFHPRVLNGKHLMNIFKHSTQQSAQIESIMPSIFPLYHCNRQGNR